MKLAFSFVSVFSLLAGVWAAVFAFNIRGQSRRVDPGPENESAFLRDYHPGNALRRFYLPNEPCTWGSSHGSNSDNHYVHHSLDFQSDCIIKTNLKKQLVDVIQAEISRRQLTHAYVTQKHEEPNGGYSYTYKSGNSVGSIMVDPVEHPFVQRDRPLPEDLEDVRIKLRIEEKWNEWCLRCATN
jgi:hypothetical protein